VATQKATVFIASRFDEFTELRKALVLEIAATKPMAAIDLNDGYARHEPPLAECLARVRGADLMVLLIGDSYGPNAPGKTKSFTHLEYDEAARDGSKTRLLVYRVHERGAKAGERRAADEWLRELQEKHTPKELDVTLAPKARASEITKHLFAALYDLRFGKLSDEDDEYESDLDETEDAFDDSEIESLDAADAEARGEAGDAIDDLPAGSEGRRPAAAAAIEQRLEAERATQLGEYGIAIQHLRKALDLRPLDGLANFWLARLYIVLNREDRLGEAVNLAERAARIAKDEQRPYRASRSYLLAARALTAMSHFPDAHRAVDLALEQKPDFAKAYIERARICCADGRRAPAVAAVREAFRYHSRSLPQALRDPHLESIRADLRDLLREQTALWQRDVMHLLAIESWLGTQVDPPLSEAAPAPPSTENLQTLRHLGQDSVKRQRELVGTLVSSAKRRYLDSRPETSGSTAAQLVSNITREEQQLSELRGREREAAQILDSARKLPLPINAQVVVSVVVAVGAAVQITVPWAVYVVLCVGLVFTVQGLWHSRKRLDHARAHRSASGERHSQLASACAEAEAGLARRRAELAELQAAGERARTKAQAAVEAFEQRALSMPARYQPYPSLRHARPQKLVRVSAKSLEQFEQLYRRRIEKEAAPSWLGEESAPDGFALYRVVSVSPTAIRLSRTRVYEGIAAGVRAAAE
jgi:tetratricopeptide (TPR) repeat protein